MQTLHSNGIYHVSIYIVIMYHFYTSISTPAAPHTTTCLGNIILLVINSPWPAHTFHSHYLDVTLVLLYRYSEFCMVKVILYFLKCCWGSGDGGGGDGDGWFLWQPRVDVITEVAIYYCSLYYKKTFMSNHLVLFITWEREREREREREI